MNGPTTNFMTETIDDLAQRWLDLDQDDSTRQEIQQLVQSNNVAELESRLRNRIAFGTAGLRSSMKAGFAHMNSVTVLQASQGLATYILDQCRTLDSNATNPVVVIGFDARHNSEKFARLAAATFLTNGYTVLWFGNFVHTPMVPFSVKHFEAAAGIMITASHNPKEDNGYKVYWSNGCQIIPPHDTGIAHAIQNDQSTLTWDSKEVDRNPNVRNITLEATELYFHSIRSLAPNTRISTGPVRFMYTPMHGVGLPFMRKVPDMLGLEGAMKIVKSQAEPDPDFPTVPFPNPEEQGALDKAKQDAELEGCSLILANDPDADRFAAVEHLSDGMWHQFSGNQMGVLLASYLLESHAGPRNNLAMLASTVSSRMLAVIAAKEGFHFQETLTGFKWLGNVGQGLERQGYTAAYAYEEAIGYMFSSVVWDKDGIAAAAMFLAACLDWKKQGYTPWQKLQQLYETYGYFEDANTYLISPSPALTNTVFNDIRALDKGSRPSMVGSRKILRWRDLTLGYDSGTNDNKPDLPVDANAQMITCELEDVVFTARGSGTEPKIKLYIEARGHTSVVARKRAHSVLDDLLKEWFKAEYGLRLAGM